MPSTATDLMLRKVRWSRTRLIKQQLKGILKRECLTSGREEKEKVKFFSEMSLWKNGSFFYSSYLLPTPQLLTVVTKYIFLQLILQSQHSWEGGKWILFLLCLINIIVCQVPVSYICATLLKAMDNQKTLSSHRCYQMPNLSCRIFITSDNLSQIYRHGYEGPPLTMANIRTHCAVLCFKLHFMLFRESSLG